MGNSKTTTNNQSIIYFTPKQSSDLLAFLISLTEEKEITINDFLELERIYTNDTFSAKYHHFYKDIYSVLTVIQNDKSSIDVLGQNIAYIEKHYTVQKYDIRPEIEKLYDHLNLEIARLNYTTSIQSQTESMIGNLIEQTEKTNKRFSEIESKSKEIEKKLEKSQVDYITVLGVFASVILAFVGAFTFSTSVLNNIKDVSIYRLICVSVIIGLVFFNTIFALLQYVIDFSKREKPWQVFKFFNITFIALLVITSFAYFCKSYSENLKVVDTPVQVQKDEIPQSESVEEHVEQTKPYFTTPSK